MWVWWSHYTFQANYKSMYWEAKTVLFLRKQAHMQSLCSCAPIVKGFTTHHNLSRRMSAVFHCNIGVKVHSCSILLFNWNITWFNWRGRFWCCEVLDTDVVPQSVISARSIGAVNNVSVISTSVWVVGKEEASCIVADGWTSSPVQVSALVSEDSVSFWGVVSDNNGLESVVLWGENYSETGCTCRLTQQYIVCP